MFTLGFHSAGSLTNDGLHDSLTLRWCKSDTLSEETELGILNLDLFPAGDMW
jgi:hypothetical protein